MLCAVSDESKDVVLSGGLLYLAKTMRKSSRLPRPARWDVTSAVDIALQLCLPR